ncbi:hypothetical protein KI659_09700 [Litoribacter alkaliphilus]|uniref:DUF4382 domain-containing protein n=1 Tax=Litoribacter ruber TaxID=702568 RepID=A0AAP2G597_9BACT|nr:hypothetical protein [Litoribacter alkaliphilus]MBS9524288.1 hypothetical protein [Litoribacter alkaliphilus]
MKKRILSLSLLSAMAVSLFSCNNNEQDQLVSNVTVSARAIAVNAPGPNQRNINGATFVTMDVGLRDVGLLEQGDQPNAAKTISNGPHHFRLMRNTAPQTEQIGSAQIRHGEFDRLAVRLDRNQSFGVDGSDGTSLFIVGSVNDRDLHIFTTAETVLSVDADGGPYSITSDEQLYLNVDMNTLFTGINFNDATDGNGDGTIEIEPDNVDGNAALYQQIMGNLPSAVSLTRE